MDENLSHCSYEAGVLEDPDHTPVSSSMHFFISGHHLLTGNQPKDLWKMTLDPLDAPDAVTEFNIHFEKGIPVKVTQGDQEATDSVELFKLLNKIGHDNGVGRIDIVETRLLGIKSRGCYDTPGLTIA
jgi:argininosuccinate synthase